MPAAMVHGLEDGRLALQFRLAGRSGIAPRSSDRRRSRVHDPDRRDPGRAPPRPSDASTSTTQHVGGPGSRSTACRKPCAGSSNAIPARALDGGRLGAAPRSCSARHRRARHLGRGGHRAPARSSSRPGHGRLRRPWRRIGRVDPPLSVAGSGPRTWIVTGPLPTSCRHASPSSMDRIVPSMAEHIIGASSGSAGWLGRPRLRGSSRTLEPRNPEPGRMELGGRGEIRPRRGSRASRPTPGRSCQRSADHSDQGPPSRLSGATMQSHVSHVRLVGEEGRRRPTSCVFVLRWIRLNEMPARRWRIRRPARSRFRLPGHAAAGPRGRRRQRHPRSSRWSSQEPVGSTTSGLGANPTGRDHDVQQPRSGAAVGRASRRTPTHHVQRLRAGRRRRPARPIQVRRCVQRAAARPEYPIWSRHAASAGRECPVRRWTTSGDRNVGTLLEGRGRVGRRRTHPMGHARSPPHMASQSHQAGRGGASPGEVDQDAMEGVLDDTKIVRSGGDAVRSTSATRPAPAGEMGRRARHADDPAADSSDDVEARGTAGAGCHQPMRWRLLVHRIRAAP